MNKWERIIKDKDETIKRLQEELEEKSDFIFKLIEFIEDYKLKSNNFNKSFPNLENYSLELYGIYTNKIRRNVHQDNYATACSHEYLPYDTKVCPHCGGKIKHPYTGEVTSEQIDEDINTCLLIEVIDEYDNTLGYEAICKKDWKHEN